MLAHVEAVAFAAEQIVGRHLQILDLDLGMAAVQDVVVRPVDRHVGDVALDVVAGVRQFDDEGRELLAARRVGIGLGHDKRDVGDAGRRREPRLAVEDVIRVAVLHRGGLHPRGIGAGGLFGHREADPLVAVEQGF